MFTPTVTELPRALEPVSRDTFLAGGEAQSRHVAPTRIGLAPIRRAAAPAPIDQPTSEGRAAA